MNIKAYKADVFTKQHGYKSFKPNFIEKEWIIDNPQISQLLEEANYKLGELNAFSTFVPDVDVFVKMHIVKEATQSSRIEGTRTNIDEAVLDEKDILPEDNCSKDNKSSVRRSILLLLKQTFLMIISPANNPPFSYPSYRI